MIGQKYDKKIDELRAGMVTAERVILNNEEDINILTIRTGTVLSEEMIGRLRRNKVEILSIYPSIDHVPKAVKTPPVEPVIDEALREEAVESIRNLFGALVDGNMTTAHQVVKELDDIVEQLVDTISSDSNAFVHITDLKSYDEYTYHHSLSVAVLSIAIGKSMNLNAAQLKKLGQCAILHDIGKTEIQLELINLPRRLTAQEFEAVQQHAQKGAQYLMRNQIGDAELWRAVAYHHEKMNGRGYPQGLRGEAIPLYSRIISVADVYDAVTSYRPYRDPMPPAEAIELIMSEVDTSFDYNIVTKFVDNLEVYPINTVVELSDGRQGMVIENTINLRPILKMLDDDSTLDLMDLNNLSLIIAKVLD